MSREIMAFVLIACQAGCFPSLRKTFADMSYPHDLPPSPTVERAAHLASALLPTLVVGYSHPATAGACYETLAADPDLFNDLEILGNCLANPTATSGGSTSVPTDHWFACMNANAAFLRSCETALQSAGGADKAQAALALASLGEAFFSYRLTTTKQTQATPLTPEDRDDFLKVLGSAAKLLRCDPSNANANGDCDLSAAPTGSTQRATYPALALAGGAANGAFTAGYLFALLSAREQAFGSAAGDPAKLAQLQRERFGQASGTSIGALIGTLLDLYYVDVDATTLPPASPAVVALSQCLGGSLLSPRAAPQCALSMMEAQFTTTNEWDALCVEKGDFSDLVANQDHIVRFDPLANTVINPFLSNYGELILENDFVRIAMAVDFQNDVLVGLDERACRLPGMPTHPCLSSAVMASIVLPVFVERIERVYSGLIGATGEAGFWLDGGVRSATPALQAVSLASVTADRGARLLAINNGRAEGGAKGIPGNVLGVTFAAMAQFSQQIGDWEMGMAALFAQVQRARGCYLAQQLGYTACVTTSPMPAGARVLMRLNRSPMGGSLMPVFVPEHVPRYYAAEGYTFDPHVMRGLFFWGQKTFLDSRNEILTFLAWDTMKNEAATWMTTRLAQVDAEIAAQYAISPPKAWQDQHRYDRRDKVMAKMPDCPPH